MLKVEIGTASAEAGEKSFGRLNVAKTTGGIDVFIPVTIINGVEKGPTFVVNAGMHGDEVTGCEALVKLAQKLDPKKLKGTLIIVPILNVSAFPKRVTIWDGRELGGSVEPNKDGTISEIITYAFKNEIVAKGDYWLDMHCGRDTWEFYTSYPVPSPDDDPEVLQRYPDAYKTMKEMALAFGVDQVLYNFVIPFEPLKKGRPLKFAAEIGGGDWLDADQYVDVIIKGITNVLKYLGMLEGKPEPQAEKATIYDSPYYVCNGPRGGFWDLKVKFGDKVKKGQIVGVILDPLTGEELDRMISPVDGIVVNSGHVFKVANPLIYLLAFGKPIETVNLKEYFRK